jgi:seryl-tRNA synthetase
MTVDLHALDGLSCHANGQVTLSGPLLQLEHRLDALFLTWAADCGAVEFRFPPLVAARALDRIDYFHAFPHLATFPVALSRDEAHLRAFTASRPVTRDGEMRLGALDPVREVLTPAACYPIYAHFQGACLETPSYVTTRATCFRREAHYEPLARQWAFSMREIVCLGGRAEVVAFLEHYRAHVMAFAAALDLPLCFAAATDSFFDPPRNPQHIVQRLAPAKQEMMFDGRLAIGSLNFHRRHFGTAFEISRDGSAAYSACVAFGLERWILAIIERFGAQPTGWPELPGNGTP